MTSRPTPWTAEIVTAGERHAAADRGARVRVSQPSTPTALGFGRYPPRFKALPPTPLMPTIHPPDPPGVQSDTPHGPPPTPSFLAEKADTLGTPLELKFHLKGCGSCSRSRPAA
jgi:hypothetical protein